jgi:hypothetical protein
LETNIKKILVLPCIYSAYIGYIMEHPPRGELIQYLLVAGPLIGISSGVVGAVGTTLFMTIRKAFKIDNLASVIAVGIASIPFIVIGALTGTFVGTWIGMILSKIIG